MRSVDSFTEGNFYPRKLHGEHIPYFSKEIHPSIHLTFDSHMEFFLCLASFGFDLALPTPGVRHRDLIHSEVGGGLIPHRVRVQRLEVNSKH